MLVLLHLTRIEQHISRMQTSAFQSKNQNETENIVDYFEMSNIDGRLLMFTIFISILI